MLSEVSPSTCRTYVATRKKGGGRRDLEDLRAAINHHAKRDLHSGLITVELPPKGKPRDKYLTRDEIARLLWVCWRHKREQVPPRGLRKGERVPSRAYFDMRHLARFILMGIHTASRTTPNFFVPHRITALAGRSLILIGVSIIACRSMSTRLRTRDRRHRAWVIVSPHTYAAGAIVASSISTLSNGKEGPSNRLRLRGDTQLLWPGSKVEHLLTPCVTPA